MPKRCTVLCWEGAPHTLIKVLLYWTSIIYFMNAAWKHWHTNTFFYRERGPVNTRNQSMAPFLINMWLIDWVSIGGWIFVSWLQCAAKWKRCSNAKHRTCPQEGSGNEVKNALYVNRCTWGRGATDAINGEVVCTTHQNILNSNLEQTMVWCVNMKVLLFRYCRSQYKTYFKCFKASLLCLGKSIHKGWRSVFETMAVS
jgi:hypothetical protein